MGCFLGEEHRQPFWKACWVGAQKAAAEVKGIKLTYTSPTKADNIDEQTRMMEDIILQRPQGIVFVPVDYVALVPTVEKMNKANIPVFNYCNEMAGGKYHIYVGCDDETLAYEIATYAFKAVGNKGKVIIQDGVPGAITAQNRKKDLTGPSKIPGHGTPDDPACELQSIDAMQVMENLLQRFPKVDVVLAANDEQALDASRH